MRKFDQEQPYVFISYTKKDKDFVYPFVERLRENEANVWMDDLLGRRAGSWVTDVLPLVVDKNRVLTLYFRSENSLINKNIYQEIEKSIRVSGDKSVHIVDLYPHENNMEIYTKLYRQRDTIEIFTKMIQYIDEEANAYLYNNESDFVELLEYLKELGVIIQDKGNIQDKVIIEDTSSLEKNEKSKLYYQNATIEIVQDKYIMKKDSVINKSVVDSCPEGAKRIRKELIESGELVEEQNGYRLVVDKEFKSLSGAACFVAGGSVSGTLAWKEQPNKKSDSKPCAEIKETKDFLVPGMEVYVKKHEGEVGIITEGGKVSYKDREVSLNQFVQVILGPGSRNAYLYVYEKSSKKSLAELRDADLYEEKESEEKGAPISIEVIEVERDCIGSEITIEAVRTFFEDDLKALDFREIRENMPRGGKGAIDYAMAAILGGCNQVTEESPKYQINYYIYDVATQDDSKKKQDGKLGATWTWSSNCRKVLGLDKAGQIPKEINAYFENLPEATTLGDIEQWFKEGKIDAFKTKKNDMVMYGVQQIIAFMENGN